MISANKEQKLYITEIQKKIMDAFLVVANESNSGTRITMNEIANKVRMTPQAIYRKHFKSVIEISDTIRDEITDDIIKAMVEAFVKDKNLPILEAIAREVIPVMYKYRFAIRIFYHYTEYGDWFSYIGDGFVEWARPFLKKDLSDVSIARESLLRLYVRIIIQILLQWVAEDSPAPPSIYCDEFLELCEMLHLSDYFDRSYLDDSL